MASFFSWRPAWAATPLAESGNCDRRYTRKSGTENVMSKELWNWNEDNKHGVRIWLWEYLKREYENTNKLPICTHMAWRGLKQGMRVLINLQSVYKLFNKKYPLIKVTFEVRRVWADSAVGKESVSKKNDVVIVRRRKLFIFCNFRKSVSRSDRRYSKNWDHFQDPVFYALQLWSWKFLNGYLRVMPFPCKLYFLVKLQNL